MSSVSETMLYLKAIFDKYAGKKGDSTTLTKKELIEMFHTEIPETKMASKSETHEFFKVLDEDGDGVVDFPEFVTFLANLTLLYAMY